MSDESKNDCKENKLAAGCLKSLVYGAQDKWTHEADPEDFDIRPHLLSGKYCRRFGELKCNMTVRSSDMTFKIQNQCDALNGLVLVINNPERKRLQDCLKSVETEIGGQRFDIFNCEDIETQISFIASLWGKQIKQHGDKLFVPVCLAPFHEPNNFAITRGLYHELRVHVRLHRDMECKLWANLYFLSDEAHAWLDRSECIQMLTYQNQYTGGEECNQQINKFRLNFNHPISILFFWGPCLEKANIAKVQLTLDGHLYLDCTIDELEYEWQERNYRQGDDSDTSSRVIPIIFSHQKWFSKDLSGINMSRIDKATLILHCKEVISSEIYICGINQGPFRTSGGLGGLAFSK